jgi:hypothetical protein
LRGDQIAYVFGDRKLIVLQSRGTFFTKAVGPGTHVNRVRVNGEEALWVSGARHFFGYIDTHGASRPEEPYLAGNVLIWQRNELTLRLEGKLSQAKALTIARSFR